MGQRQSGGFMETEKELEQVLRETRTDLKAALVTLDAALRLVNQQRLKQPSGPARPERRKR